MNETLRYEYPLKTDDVVIDCGGYEGRFAIMIHQMYGCKVDIYEPVKYFYMTCLANKSLFPIIRAFHKGVGNSNRREIFHIQTDRTGLYAEGETEEVEIIDIKDVIRDRHISLLKLNIEGMEYEVLERIIECDLQQQIDNIQVQFHKIGDNYEERCQKIRDKLLETHELTYDLPFVWSNFQIKNKNVV
jgi:FkbM family methyltransferase